MEFIASFSGGKDSTAMILKLLEYGKPLTTIIFFDTKMEYKAIYTNVEKMKKLAKEKNIKFVTLTPDSDFLTHMLTKPHYNRRGNLVYGYDWCGGKCRWMTSLKVSSINNYLSSIPEYKQYIGIAYDEPKRIKNENNKLYPLVNYKMTEKDCLEYCYENGFNWNEDGIELYDILDRVSCWCCKNKNLKELRNMYHYLPDYWGMLKGMQSRIDRPFYDCQTVFQLEKRFIEEDKQLSLFDFM